MTTFQFHGESDEHFRARVALTERGLGFHVHGMGFQVQAPGAKFWMTGAEVLTWLEGQR